MFKSYILCIGGNSYLASHFIKQSTMNLIAITRQNIIVKDYKYIEMPYHNTDDLLDILLLYDISFCINFTRQSLKQFDKIINIMKKKHAIIISFGSLSEFQFGQKTNYALSKTEASTYANNMKNSILIYFGIVYGNNYKLNHDLFRLQNLIKYFSLEDLYINTIHINCIINVLNLITSKAVLLKYKKLYLPGNMMTLRELYDITKKENYHFCDSLFSNESDLPPNLRDRLRKWREIHEGAENHYFHFFKATPLDIQTIYYKGYKILCEK